MINPNELRIGNYINIAGIQPIDKVYVTGVLPDKIYYTPSKNKQFSDFLYTILSYVEPISLTEEWHNKFGVFRNGFHSFEYKITDNKKIIFSGDYIYLRDIHDLNNRESIGDDICTLWNKDIKKRDIYVHEWQNLWFALTGEELTIK